MATNPNIPTSHPPPLQQVQLKQADLEDPNLSFLNNLLTQMQTQISSLVGAGGPTPLPSGVDVKGATVKNIGPPVDDFDAVSKSHAEANYSAAALAPQLEAGNSSKTTLKSYRAVNSKVQHESYSNFLENIMNTTPTANTSTLSADAPAGGSVSVTISAGYHVFPSGKAVSYGQRTDTLTLPITFAISSIARASGIVTATLSSAPGWLVGQQIYVTGVSDTSYNGTFVILTITGATITWAQIGGDSSSSGGTASENGCYYYYIGINSNMLALAGPYSSDVQSNRVNVNQDGFVLIAVIVLNSSGFDFAQSAAGATPPASTGNSRLLLRL